VNPFRGVFIFVFAIVALAGMNFFTSTACAQNRARGEFNLKQKTHWENAILPEGNYLYSIETMPSPAVVRVWQKGGGFSGVFVPQSLLQENSLGHTEIVLRQVGDGPYVTSFHVPSLNAELIFSIPEATADSTDLEANHAPDHGSSGARTSDLFTIINPNHTYVSIAEAEKVYLKVCQVVEMEFNRPTPVRPRLTLRLGAGEDLLHYPNREIRLKKWDEIQFAEAIVDLALHDMVTPVERLRLSKTAVSRANMTVSLCELKVCVN